MVSRFAKPAPSPKWLSSAAMPRPAAMPAIGPSHERRGAGATGAPVCVIWGRRRRRVVPPAIIHPRQAGCPAERRVPAMTHATVTRAVAGVDFTSAPTRRKPITVATGHSVAGVVKLERLHLFASFDTFATWLRTPGPWVAAIDMPFGLPRELVTALGWPAEWLPLMRHYTALSRAEIRSR